MNFMKKFTGIVRFENDHFGAIMGYGDYVIGDSMIFENGVVKRWNQTLVKAARTMLIFSKALMFLWAAAVATACYAQNRSLIHTRHNKTPYELVHDKKPDLNIGPKPILLTHGQISLGLVSNHIPAAPYVPPTNKDLEILFQLMFDEYLEPPSVERMVPHTPAVQV
nr:putative ribonuclease H-like domain-containing protein [Tanacetum cinerariifolium]